MSDTNAYLLKMSGITKSFGVVPVLKGVDLTIYPGEIHALLGENGAGKSTLIKILSGAYQKDKGQIFVEGTEVNPKNTHQGQVLGISVVYQELSLVNDLSVAENIYLHKFGVNKFWMNWKELKANAQELLDSLEFTIDASAIVRDLSIVQKQVVEIAKALAEDTKILVLDEPTTVFDPTEIERLFKNLRRLKNEGISIIYISHHLEEIFKIADTITVLKDGKVTGSMPVSEIDNDGIIRLMIGRELSDLYPKREVTIGKTPNFGSKESNGQ